VFYLFLMGFLSFIAGSALSYMPTLKGSPYYFLMWTAVTAVSTLAWALLAKAVPDSTRLVVVGLYWDTLMQVTYLLIPVMIFGARLTMLQTSGILLIFCGILMARG